MLPYPDRRDPELHVQREAMKLAVQEPVVTGPVFDALAPETFGHPAYRALFDATQAIGGVAASHGGAGWVTALMGKLDDAVARALVTELGVEEIRVDPEMLRAYASSVLAKLQEVWVGGQVAQVKSMLSRMRPSDDEAAYRQLFADLLALEEYRRELLAESLRVQVD